MAWSRTQPGTPGAITLWQTTSDAVAAACLVDAFAVVPLRHSIAGAVAVTGDCLTRFPQLQVVDGLDLAIVLVWAARPGVQMRERIDSHPVAYRPARRVIERRYPEAMVVPATSTASAACAAAEDRGSAAASCSSAAAAAHDLTAVVTLTPAGNCTTFVVVALREPHPMAS